MLVHVFGFDHDHGALPARHLFFEEDPEHFGGIPALRGRAAERGVLWQNAMAAKVVKLDKAAPTLGGWALLELDLNEVPTHLQRVRCLLTWAHL
jgi:hypothetical protein